MTTQKPQGVSLTAGLDALGHELEVERLTEPDDGLHQ
jgi:hypothetical protein